MKVHTTDGIKVVQEVSVRADRQTDAQTYGHADTLIAVLRTPSRSKEITTVLRKS